MTFALRAFRPNRRSTHPRLPMAALISCVLSAVGCSSSSGPSIAPVARAQAPSATRTSDSTGTETRGSTAAALQATVVRIDFTPAGPLSFIVDAAGSQPLLVTAYDANGNRIVGTFANPIVLTVSNSDGKPFTTISKNGGAPARGVTMDSSNDSVTLHYAAGTREGYFATITADAAGAGPATTWLDAFSVTLSSNSLTAGGSPATLTATEQHLFADYDYFTISQTNAGTAACPTDALVVSDFYTTPPQLVTIVPYLPGECTLEVSDGSLTIPVTIQIGPPRSTESGGHLLGVLRVNGASNSTIVSYSTIDPAASQSFSTPANDSGGAIAADHAGDVYVATTHSGGNYALEKYPVGTTGAATPIASVPLSDPMGLGQVAIDASGNVYVVLTGHAEVAEYNSALSTQIATLTGPSTGLSAGGNAGTSGALAVDTTGNLYVGTAGNGIAVFAPLRPGSNDTAPSRYLETPPYKGAGFSSAVGTLAVDASGDVFYAPAVFAYSIAEYPAGTNSTPQYFAPGNGYAAFGIAIDRGRLYTSTAYTPGNHVVPDGQGWVSFQITNPKAAPLPFINPASLTYNLAAY